MTTRALIRHECKVCALWAIWLLNIADFIITAYALRHGAVEMNPAMSLLLRIGGIPLFGVFKLGFGTYILCKASYYRNRLRMWLLFVIIAVYGFVIVHNVLKLAELLTINN